MWLPEKIGSLMKQTIAFKPNQDKTFFSAIQAIGYPLGICFQFEEPWIWKKQVIPCITILPNTCFCISLFSRAYKLPLAFQKSHKVGFFSHIAAYQKFFFPAGLLTEEFQIQFKETLLCQRQLCFHKAHTHFLWTVKYV